MWNGNGIGNFILPGSSYCDLVFMDKICLCGWNAQSNIEVYCDGIMRVWHIRIWCRVQSSKKINWISMMISLVCLAYQGWTLLQYEWSKWPGKTEKSQFKIIPLCWSWSSELYKNTVHIELGYCNVCALCVPRRHKRAKINVLR